MRNSLLASVALAGVALLCSVPAMAVPIRVGLRNAAGSHQWTSDAIEDPSYVTLSAWQYDDGTWIEAIMTDTVDGPGNPGLGVCGGSVDANNACTSTDETSEIDSIPRQMIEMDISLFEHWNGMTITLLSYEQESWDGFYGVSCSLTDSECINPTPVQLQADCSGPDANGINACTFTEGYLTQLGIAAIWISPYYGCGSEVDSFATFDRSNSGCNFLLGSGLEHGLVLDLNHVPEPAVLGMFGLGALLIGLFVGLRRREQH